MSANAAPNLSPVLIVEDDNMIRELLTNMLEVQGYDVQTAASREDAMERIRNNKFAIGLIDLGLPDGNGLSLLPEFKSRLPWMVPIILTGDNRPESIIETMRAGAFDYLTKPVDAMTLKAAMSRARDYHEALRDRDHVVQLLSDEREQLKVRVEEATKDIRNYAARRNSLLNLARISSDAYTDETLLRGLFDEVSRYHPVQCIALCAPAQEEFIAIVLDEDQNIRIVNSQGHWSEATPRNDGDSAASNEQIRNYVNEHTGLDTTKLASTLHPQTFWGRAVCTVAFFFPRDTPIDEGGTEFLNMCAHFAASEWQEARLFLHATQQASLGNIALEISNSLVQGLTAIRIASDYVSETEMSPDAAEGLKIVSENVEKLQRQIQEFNRLSAVRRDTVETVHLNQYIEQALDMLSMAIRNRGITIEREYDTDFHCLLLNGTALARTFLDLLSCAVRTVEAGGRIVLKLTQNEEENILFQMSYEVMSANPFEIMSSSREAAMPDPSGSYPRFLLAQRTIRSCGGKLVLGHEREGLCLLRMLLPQNAMEYTQTAET